MLWSGLLGGCYSPSPPLGVPCSSTQECPNGQECDLLTNVCGYPTEARTLRDDTAADFDGGDLQGAVIESGGFVGPVPYFVHGVRATGIAGNQLAADIDAVQFDDLAQITPTGRGVLRGVDIGLGDGVPPLLGFTSGDDITVLLEGEIYLDAPGNYTFELRANDIGFIEIAAPGSATFERLGDADITAVTFPYSAPSAGWYRFRGAFADSMQYFEWELRYRPPTGGMRSIPDDIVRARVDGLDGVIVDGFDEAWMALYVGVGLTDKLDGLTFTGPNPYGLDLGVSSHTLRWTAQFLVDMEGDYRFKLDTSQGHRAWIDGMQVANDFNGAAQVTTTMPIHLVAGWHDLVIDAVKTGGSSSRLSFTVESGPQFAGGAIPPDHLRPVSGRNVRFSSGTNSTNVDLVDGATVSRSVGLDVPAGITTLAIDANFYVSHPLREQLTVTLDPAVGSNISLLAAGDFTGPGDVVQHDVIPVDRGGSNFNFIIGDTTVDTPPMIGVVEWVTVTTTYAGGRPPYEASATYTSTVRDLGAARFNELTWSMRQAQVEPIVSVRTCDEEAACEAEPWTTVLDGAVPSAPARRYFQYKVEITSDLDVPTSLDWIDLQYVGYVEP